MTRTKITLAAIIALTAAGGASALAAGNEGMQHGDHGARMEQRFAEMDADKDGKVTPAEMRAYRDARFATADANGDGKVTVEELDDAGKAERLERHRKMVLWLDADGNGMLSPNEFDQRRGMMMSRMDSDGDGAISQEEMGEARKRFHRGHGGHHRGHGMQGGGMQGGGMQGGGMHGGGMQGGPETNKN